jgi:hypothetical protein
VAEFIGAQRQLRGFWRAASGKTEAVQSATQPALPPTVLMEMLRAFPRHPDAARWRDAVRMHLDEYLLPLAARSAYRIIPYGVYVGRPSEDRYRRFAGDVTYRFFMPLRIGSSQNPRRKYLKWYGSVRIWRTTPSRSQWPQSFSGTPPTANSPGGNWSGLWAQTRSAPAS